MAYVCAPAHVTPDTVRTAELAFQETATTIFYAPDIDLRHIQLSYTKNLWELRYLFFAPRASLDAIYIGHSDTLLPHV